VCAALVASAIWCLSPITTRRWLRAAVALVVLVNPYTITQVPKARLSAELGVFDQVVPERLVLITCGGKFDPVARHYADNLVVVAEPVDARP